MSFREMLMDSNKTHVAADEEQNAELESEDDKRMRIKSLRIIYFTMFLMTLGFSIILTGIWPYLDKVFS